MLFRSKAVLNLGFNLLLQSFRSGSTVPSESQAANHHEVQLFARFCSSGVPYEYRPEPLEDRTLDVEEGDDGMKLVLR